MLVSMFVQGAVRGASSGNELDVRSAKLAGTDAIIFCFVFLFMCCTRSRSDLSGLEETGPGWSAQALEVALDMSSSACSLYGQLAVTAVTAAQGTAGTPRYWPGATSSTAGLACPLHDACRPWS